MLSQSLNFITLKGASVVALKPVLRLDDVLTEILQWEYWELVSPGGPLSSAAVASSAAAAAASKADPGSQARALVGNAGAGGGQRGLAVPKDFTGIESYTETFK